MPKLSSVWKSVRNGVPRRARERSLGTSGKVAAGTIGVTAASIFVVALLVFYAAPVRASVTLTSSNWAASCNDQQSTGAYIIQTGDTNWDIGSLANNANGLASSLEAIYAAAGQPTVPTSSELNTKQYFDLGPSASSGCWSFSTPSSKSVTVTYSWHVNAADQASAGCAASGTYGFSTTVKLVGDIHQYGGWVGTVHSSSTITVLTLTTGGTVSCPSGGGDQFYDHSTVGPQTYSVSFTGTVYANTNYDFWSNLWIDQQASVGTSGSSAALTMNITAQLYQISCPSC